MSLEGKHVIIAGAGVIGLSAALELRRAGATVTVCERGAAMREASWAAAGMLAAEDPENDSRLLPLARLGRALYPEFLTDVERLSGAAVPVRTTQTLQGSHEPAPRLPDLVPELAPGPWHFRLLDECSLDPRDLCAALPLAARAAGVTLREHTRVLAVTSAPDGVRVTVKPDADALKSDLFLLAAGAWSGSLRLPAPALTHVQPRKGQMIEITLPDEAPPLRVVLRTPEIYLVPRTPRRIVIGATVEDAGFDRATTAAAARALLEKAAALWPPAASATITAQWSGLRPVLADARAGLPVIGQLPGEHGRVWVATGHFRNGILLAPGTARLLGSLLCGEAPPCPAHEFDPAARDSEARRDKGFHAAL